MKYMTTPILSLVLIAGVAFAGEQASTAPHQQPQQGHPATGQTTPVDEFSKLDTNHDGKLSRAELAKHPKAAHMAMADENQDGFLSKDEFAALETM